MQLAISVLHVILIALNALAPQTRNVQPAAPVIFFSQAPQHASILVLLVILRIQKTMFVFNAMLHAHSAATPPTRNVQHANLITSFSLAQQLA